MSASDPPSAAMLQRLAALECPAFSHRRDTREGAASSGPQPIVLAEAQGSRLRDVDGKEYIDLVAGFGALLLGHGHPKWLAAVQAQSQRLVQGMGDVFASEAKLALLEGLARICPLREPQFLLGQSGSDAVTAAIKTATLATGRHAFIAFDGSYHGLGYGPLPACGYNRGFRAPFAAQLNPEVRFAPYPGVRGAGAEAALEFVAEQLRQEDVAAILVEPIMGRGGCLPPPPDFLRSLSRLAQQHGSLLIADEIWTGLGRSGAWIRSLDIGVEPDILCLGKGLGGGMSISACVAPAAVMAGWTRAGEVIHTSTHSGAPLACAAASATLRILAEEGLVARAHELGQRARNHFGERLLRHDVVIDIRGAGLMIGIELSDAGLTQRLLGELRQAGYLVLSGGVDGATLTLTPALNIPEDELLGFADVLSARLS